MDFQLHIIHSQECLILLYQCIFRLHQNPHQIFFLQILHGGNHRKTAYQLRNDTELQQIVGLDLCQNIAQIPLLFALHRGVKANGRLVCPGLNDLIQTVKGTAADEEDIAGVHGNGLLLGVLSAALRGHIGNRTLQNLQERLLHTFAGNIPGDGSVFALSGNLIHLINVNDSPLSQLHIKVSRLQQTNQDILHVVAHIACFRQGCGISDSKGNIENLGQRLGKQGLAGAGGADEQNIALLQLHLRLRCQIDTLVMVIYGYGKGDFGFVLTDNIIVHIRLHFHRRRQVVRRLRITVIIPQQITACLHTVAADIYTGTGNQTGLVFPLAAEGTSQLLCFCFCHRIMLRLSLLLSGAPKPGPQDQMPEPPGKS